MHLKKSVVANDLLAESYTCSDTCRLVVRAIKQVHHRFLLFSLLHI